MEWKTIEFENLYAESSRNGLYKSKEFHGTGIRIVNMKEIFAFPLIGEQEMQLLEVNDSELNKFGLQIGDLLFARRSLVEEGSGKCVLVVENKTPIVFESSIIRVRLNKNECFPLFYYYYFRSPIGRLGIKSIITGAGQKGIRGSELAKVQVYHPPLTEQKAIAQSLSDVDALITECDRIITKKRNTKQGMMQQLLTGKKRLPGFSGKWEVKRLGEMVNKVVGGGTPSRNKKEYWNGNIFWATVKDITSFCPYETEERITQEGLNLSASNLIPKGNLIISTRMAVGKVVIYNVDVAINQDLKAIFTKADVDTKFLFYCFTSYSSNIDFLASGSTVKGILVQDLKNIEFPYISLPEQKAIAQVLSDMDAEIAALEQKRDKYKAIKQGMMQELLTGKTRLIGIY